MFLTSVIFLGISSFKQSSIVFCFCCFRWTLCSWDHWAPQSRAFSYLFWIFHRFYLFIFIFLILPLLIQHKVELSCFDNWSGVQRKVDPALVSGSHDAQGIECPSSPFLFLSLSHTHMHIPAHGLSLLHGDGRGERKHKKDLIIEIKTWGKNQSSLGAKSYHW